METIYLSNEIVGEAAQYNHVGDKPTTPQLTLDWDERGIFYIIYIILFFWLLYVVYL